MQIKAQVLSERSDEYTGKRGPVKQQVASLLDMDEANRFVNTFDYNLSREGADKYTGKLSGKVIELGIHNFEATFNGRLRARGRIVGVQ